MDKLDTIEKHRTEIVKAAAVRSVIHCATSKAFLLTSVLLIAEKIFLVLYGFSIFTPPC